MIIVKAVNDCAAIKTENYECGMAAGGLTSGSMALAKATANVLHYCPRAEVPNDVEPTPASIDTGGLTNVGKCMVDVKTATGSLFKAALEASKIKSTCAGNGIECGRNALHLVAAVGNLGAAVGL